MGRVDLCRSTICARRAGPTWSSCAAGWRSRGRRTCRPRAGFAIAAVVARPIGGVLSDRLHPKPVVLVSLAGAAALALVIAAQPQPEIPAGVAFIAMAFFLGIGTGGVFGWVARRAPADRVGKVAGIVGAAGGLGGFFPPLAMGAIYDEADNDYTIGLSLLSVTAAVAFLFVLLRPKRERRAVPA